MKKILLFFFFQLFILKVSAEDGDTLFIQNIKEYVFKEIGTRLDGNFYTEWSKEEKPFLYLYVSLPDKIKRPPEQNSPFIYCGTDEKRVRESEKYFTEKRYHHFCYKAYANSAAMLNKRLLSYRNESKSFIVFHELIHNYLQQMKIKVPYEFNEAMSDVIGNYETLKYAADSGKISITISKQQLETNEALYECMNHYIRKIESHPGKVNALNKKCTKKIHHILKNADAFQTDRFNYEVNNAFLLKNEYYCKNYFLLKKVFLKQKSLGDFLEIIKKMPERVADCELYLKSFS
jgi:hypothetical protein